LIRIFWLAGFASLLAVSPLLTQNAHAQRHELHASDGVLLRVHEELYPYVPECRKGWLSVPAIPPEAE
jgi:hypothetical protein